MDYIEKLQDLLKQGYSSTEVAENLYLNYQSVTNTDEVYRIRKHLAIRYQCNINDIKLIGSAHTGYTNKNGIAIKRENPPDYDFAIINANVFVRYFHKVSIDDIEGHHNKYYAYNILHGKLHPVHADKNFLDMLEKTNVGIMHELDVKRHISVCFYISEKAFIDGLVEYNSNLYASELKRISELNDNKKFKEVIEELDSFNEKGINMIEKLEG